MNAKNILKLIEQHAADARNCYPSDHKLRSMYFACALGNELTAHGEAVGAVVRSLMDHKTDTSAAEDATP